ncbi:MAG: TonB family protein [Nitrospirota bacterium]
MSNSILLDQNVSVELQCGIKFSSLIAASVLLHFLLLSILFSIMPPSIRPPIEIEQRYEVSLVASKSLNSDREKVVQPSPLLPTPLMSPPLQTPVDQKKTNVEVQTKKSSPKQRLLSEKTMPPAVPSSTHQGETVAAIPPIAALPKEPPALPVAPQSLPATNGVSATTLVDGGAHGGGSFNYPYYLRSLEQKIGANWAPPPATVSLKSEGAIAMIVFIIKKNGRIDPKSILVEKSSGNTFFDMAALRAVHKASPLPPLPVGVFDDLRVHFSFAVGMGRE